MRTASTPDPVVGREVDIRCANRHSDLHRRGVDVAQFTEHAHPFLEFDERDDERQRAARHLRRVVHHEAEHRAPAAGDDVVDRGFLVLPHRGHRRVLQAAVGRCLDAQFVRLDAVPEELGVPRGGRPHHGVGVQIVGHRRLIGIARPELHDAPVHFGDILVADLPDDVLVDEIAFAQRGLLRPDHVGQFGADADLFAGAQVAVVGLLAVGRDDADIACLVEQFDDARQRVVVGANSAQPQHRPDLDHRRRRDDAGMAGGPGRGLVDVDRVAVADGLHPVVDHRLVHRIAADPRLAAARPP